jgi:asparagine synthase (glutamine-hydrolysing)
VCGIAGIFRFHGRPADAALARRMGAALAHRGPEADGLHAVGPCALAHRRLRIIDLEGGAQPLSNEDGSVTIAFNGEIYNFQDLSRELAARGHGFRTRSDTEAIVHAYEEWGERCVERLEGMFAFAIHDARPPGRLFLARDRLGQKPLYYALDEAGIRFASEMKGLLVDPDLPRRLDRAALEEYLAFGFVPAPRTILASIRKLEAASTLALEANGRARGRRYWEVPPPERAAGERFEEAAERLAAELERAVRAHLIADVPVGAFLSGGIDSSTIVALMARAAGGAGRVRTFSIGFAEREADEVAAARAVAARLGTSHREWTLRPAALEVLPALVHHFDEPFADATAISTFFVAKLAREEVTVALTGDGADEALGGYARHGADLREARLRAMLPRGLADALARAAPDAIGLARRARTLFAGAAAAPDEAYFRSLSVLRPEDAALLFGERAEALEPARERVRGLYARTAGWTPLARALHVDLSMLLPDYYLTKVDRASMAHALEVRPPFLDHRIVEACARMPDAWKLRGAGPGKRILRRAVQGLVPREVRARPKHGFDVPVGAWLEGELAPLAREMLLGPGAMARELFRPGAVERIVADHVGRRRARGALLYALLMLELWGRRWLAGAEIDVGRAMRPGGRTRGGGEAAQGPLAAQRTA